MRKNTIVTIAFPIILGVIVPAVFAAQPATQSTPAPFRARPLASGPIKVGPAKGTVVPVGGGAIGPRVWKAFIDAAGGPDALILDVPNNSIEGAASVAPKSAGEVLRRNGARNVHVLFTQSRAVANSDAFIAIIKKARGIWFDGGRQYLVMRAYGGTKTERAFRDVLARGGVIGGSSAGTAILGDFMVRGAPSHDNYIMDYPGSDTGLGYVRNTAIDMHVVARERLPDLTSVVARYPSLLGLSVDEGTAWVIHGDTARIVGRGKAFVYNGKDPNDSDVPFLTLYPGDKYDLYTRRIISRAADESPVKSHFITSMFEKYNAPLTGGATVLVAQNGDVFVDRAFGIPAQDRYMPRTTLPQFPLGGIKNVFRALCAQSSSSAGAAPVRAPVTFVPSPLQGCVAQISRPVGLHRTNAIGGQEVRSDVDELYRLALGLEVRATWPKADYSKGWAVDMYKGVKRFAAYATPDGKRAAFVRIPSRHATVIILTNSPNADARGMSERILDQLLGASR